MDSTDDSMFRKIHGLVQAQLEGSPTHIEQQELESLLLENPAARRMYAEYLEQTACLRWLCLEEFSATCDPPMPLAGGNDHRISRRIRAKAIFAALACAFALVALGWQFIPPPNPVATSEKQLVATITGLREVRWSPANEANRLLTRCFVGERLELQEGAAELTFDAGVQLTVYAPADFEITSPSSIRCNRGRVTALANERGKGFTIDTPQAKVVDLGTQFGLSISEDGETQVIVFQGSVDLTSNSAGAIGEASSRRMEQGDALSLNKAGEFERVVSVERNQFLAGVDGIRPEAREPVIVDVRDNIRKAQSTKSYQIVHGGLQEDAVCFVDRNHEWNGMDPAGLPEFLAGADYIMPFNDDKFVRDLEITVRLARPATLYVFLDNNMEVPDWLRENFTDTGLDIGLDGAKTEWHEMNSLATGAGRSVDFPFSVWKRELKRPETVTLGGIEPPDIRSRGFNMYGIAAVATE
jgi:ferric-dicitrate binding protein FerR (iron transport regulator)